MKFFIKNEEDTQRLAEHLAKEANIGDCFALYGTLGVGKSTFAKYFIKSLNKRIEEVPSPTFTIMQEYEIENAKILHVDCYRLKNREEILEIGLLEMIHDSISLIEWPDIIESYLPQKTKKLYFSYAEENADSDIQKDSMRVIDAV